MQDFLVHELGVAMNAVLSQRFTMIGQGDDDGVLQIAPLTQPV